MLVCDDARVAHGHAETTAATIAAVVAKGNFTHVVAASDSRQKNYLFRAAGLLNVGKMTMCSEMCGSFFFPFFL